MAHFDIFTRGITFLNILSIIAFVTTVGLFFCGIPICRQIWKRRDTTEISGAPFLMGILGGTCWLTYGYLKLDYTVIWVTGAQVFLYSTYTVFYWIMSKQKLWITLKVAFVLSLCGTLITLVYFFDHKIFHPLGIICMTLNTADFAAPLAGLGVVIRRRATSTLPLPLCIANFMVSSEWFLYGLLVKDFYLITPNGIGSVLAFAQLILFVVLPRKPGQKSPIVRLFYWVLHFVAPRCLFLKITGQKAVVEKYLEQDCVDVESKKTAEEEEVYAPDEEKDPDGDRPLSRATRWSKRVIANVAGELESVCTKVGIHDQFAYSMKLNKAIDSDSEKDVESVRDTVKTSVNSETPGEIDVAALDAVLVRELEREQREKSNALRNLEERRSALKRANSSPDLSP